MRYVLLLLAGMLLMPGPVQAAPAVGYVYPPVVAAGSTTEVVIGGYDLTPDVRVLVADERVALAITGKLGPFLVPPPPYWFGNRGRGTANPIPREIAATIKVPADMPPGLVRWQVVNANGASGQGVFLVSQGQEVLEKRVRDEVQVLDAPLPLGIAGRVSRISESDRYQLVAPRDGPVTVELFARRLGADWNGVIKVRDSSGKLLADVADTVGRDLATTFAAQAGQAYTIEVHDFDFRGNRAYVYRLLVTDGPRVITTLPARLQRGQQTEVEFIGYGIASGEAKLESFIKTVNVPADPAQAELAYSLETSHGTCPAIGIPLSSLPAQVHRSGPAPSLAGECAVTGVLGSETQQLDYLWTGKAGESWRFDLASRAVGGNLDMEIVIQDAEGKQLAINDDLPGTPDAGLDFTVPADGEYRVSVRDVSAVTRDARSVFCLSAARRLAGFRVTGPQQVSVAHGGKVDVPFKLVRFGGFKGEVTLRVEKLPAGLEMGEPSLFAEGKADVKVPLQAAAELAVEPHRLRWFATATVGEQQVTQPVEVPRGGNLAAHNALGEFDIEMILAPTLAAPFSVELVDKNRQRAVHRGTTYPAPFVIKRDEGFDGQIQLQMASSQGRRRQGITGPILSVPNDATEILYPTFMPEWLETDRTTRMVVVGVGQVKGPAGNVRYVMKPADARVTMILEGALLKLNHRANELTVVPGETFAIPFTVSRSAKLPVVTTVVLEIPEPLQGVLSAAPVDVPAGENLAEITVATKPHAQLNGTWELQLKAQSLEKGMWPVISVTSFPVVFEATDAENQP